MTKSLILLVEDNDANRELAEDLLRLAGYEVVACPSGEEAMAWLLVNRPDLILMDVNLPGQDGVSLTRQIKARSETADVPVVALTAYAMRGDRDRILAAGCNGYISKPIDVSRFPEQVAEYLTSPSRRPSPGSTPKPGRT